MALCVRSGAVVAGRRRETRPRQKVGRDGDGTSGRQQVTVLRVITPDRGGRRPPSESLRQKGALATALSRRVHQ
eukprot:scaffold105791_cov48-Phaeocystis_antarctica.AAC.3